MAESGELEEVGMDAEEQAKVNVQPGCWLLLLLSRINDVEAPARRFSSRPPLLDDDEEDVVEDIRADCCWEVATKPEAEADKSGVSSVGLPLASID